MCPPPAISLDDLQQEGARCKQSLQAFTEHLIARLGLPEAEADHLRKYDASRRHGNVYLHFPFCFREIFPTVAVEHIRTLALSGVLWMSYMRAQDDTIDDSGVADPTLLFLRDLYLRESLHLLYGIFPHNSAFWRYYSEYFDEYARAVLAERHKHSTIMSSYDAAEFDRIAGGKAAMAKYPVAAQAVLSGEEAKLALLTQSLDYFHVGYQYWDDLVDWKDDLANANYSLLLARAMDYISHEDKQAKSSGQLREQISRVIYYSGLAEEQLNRSNEWLERAHELSMRAGCTAWAGHVATLQKQVAVLKSDLLSIMSRQARSV
jgi:hypothetical protein